MLRRTLLSLLLIAGCAADVGDVDRTQPNRIRKSLFSGDWFLQKTTFDVPYTAGFTFTGETSELERVRWEIQEQYLIAYRTYELVENTSKPTLLPDVDFKGAPIAAYPIESHFDVTREYNALTGEETNVLYENTADRPWYEREYLRVNWSVNLVASFNFLDDQVSQSPIAYYVQDREDADRLLVGVRNGDAWTDTQDWEEIAKLDSADYFDIVDTIFANPEVEYYEDEYGDIVEYPACWFYTSSDCQPARVKIRNSFVKVVEQPYEAMSYPDNAVARNPDGSAIRDEYGDPVRIPYFDKFGYFRVERDHYDRDRERTESGRTYLINRWGIWKNAPECKSGDSYSNCEVNQVVYYLSPGFPEELKETARLVVSQWNDAFKEVVNHLKYDGQRDLSQVEDVYVLRENTYSPDGDRGQRIGDVRYSYIYYVPEPQAVGPLGYGPSAVDPLTGRIISGNAYVYGAALESWSAFAADVVQLINGSIDPDDFIEGEDIRAYVARARGDYAATAGELEERSRREMEGAREWVRSETVLRGRKKQKELGKRGMRLDRSKVRAKLDAIRDTHFEDRLLNDELVRALAPATRGRGEGLAAHLSPEQRRKMSPANWGTTGALRAMHEKRRLKISKASLTLASFADDGVMGLAESLKGRDWQSVRDTVYASVFRSTAEHEVGHTLGLRHNFAGSFDSLNYHDQYWQLRGSSPRPFTEPSPDQTLNRMREYAYASIMDYSAHFNSDVHGLGRYDRAAILFGYGQLVEVFENPPAEPIAELVGLDFALHEMRHYTSYPRLFGGDWANMMRRRVVPYGAMISQMTGESRLEMIEVPYRFCSDEYEAAIPSCNTWDEGADPWEVVNNARKAYENYYIFNNFARDAREVEPWYHLDRVYWRYFIHPQVQYQDWVFRAFDLEGLWEYELRYDPEYYGVEDLPFDQAIDGNLGGAMASRLGLNMLAKVVQSPEPGAYYLDTDENVFYNYDYATDIPLCPPNESRADCSDLNVDLGDGKYAFSLYNGDTGYYFFERLMVVGSFYDKLAAIEAITSPETNFLGVDIDANLTGYAISMHLFFPEEVTRIVGGSATESYAAFAGVARNQRIEWRDMFAPPNLYAGMASIDPATSFTIELYAAWLGMAFLNASFDNSFNDGMRIWEEGSGEGLIPTVEDPTRIAKFTHPRTGRTFIAIRPEGPVQFAPAFDLLTRTASLAQTITDPDLRNYYIEFNTSIIDSLRGMYELYGKLYF